MTEKNGFSLKKHITVGNKLYKIRAEIVKLRIDISGAYPLNNKVNNIPKTIMDKIDELRCILDDKLSSEHLDPHNSDLNDIYYPIYIPKGE